MRVRWTEAAAADLERIADHLTEHTPVTAPQLVRAIVDAAASLTRFPNRGRPGRKASTRELVIPSLPYLIIYRVTEQAVFIARILHSAQRWP
jgi:toxin ParE1/3/4